MRYYINLFIVLMLSSHVAGCSTTTNHNQKVLDIVAVCNSGASIKMSASLEAKVAENIRQGMSVTAGIEDKLEGLFLNRNDIPEEDRLELYQNYLACVESQSQAYK